MARLEDEEFKNWKASKGKDVKKVNEGFLDDEESEDLDAYDLTQNDEGDSYVEDTPDQDAAEEGEDPDAEDDLVGDNDEEEPLETDDGETLDDGVSDEAPVDTNAQLADAIATLTQTVQQLSDKLTAEQEPAAEEPAADDLGGGDDFGDLDFGDDEGGDEDSDEDSEEDEDDGSDEDFEGDEDDDEEDDEKSEAYNANLKHGKLLNSKSGSLIGTLLSGKMYKLDEQILAVAKAKIRQRIEERKKAIRANGFEA